MLKGSQIPTKFSKNCHQQNRFYKALFCFHLGFNMRSFPHDFAFLPLVGLFLKKIITITSGSKESSGEVGVKTHLLKLNQKNA